MFSVISLGLWSESKSGMDSGMVVLGTFLLTTMSIVGVLLLGGKWVCVFQNCMLMLLVSA